MTNKIPGRCSAGISDDTGFHTVQCLYQAKVVEDGKWWCNIHKPSKRKAKEDARHAKWEERWAKEAAEHRAIACFPELLAAAEVLMHYSSPGYNMERPTSAEWERLRAAITRAKGESSSTHQAL